MNRRFLITLGNDTEHGVARLSCEQLYMHFRDIRSAAYSAQEEAGTADDAEWWSGEPPLQLETLTVGGLFEELEDQLTGSKLLKISGRSWLSNREFAEPLERVIQNFELNRGQVIFSD